MQHDFYKTGDPNIPKAILDRNNEVVLQLCKLCNKAEGELTDAPLCWRPISTAPLDRDLFLYDDYITWDGARALTRVVQGFWNEGWVPRVDNDPKVFTTARLHPTYWADLLNTPESVQPRTLQKIPLDLCQQNFIDIHQGVELMEAKAEAS